MGWADKAIKKHKTDKMIKELVDSPEYQAAKMRDRENDVLNAFCEFCFVMCEYLEIKHRYKHDGLLRFLEFAKAKANEMDEDYFVDMAQCYKDKYNLDVLDELKVEFEEGVKERCLR